jgi:hypothetical protein
VKVSPKVSSSGFSDCGRNIYMWRAQLCSERGMSGIPGIEGIEGVEGIGYHRGTGCREGKFRYVD